MGLELLGGYGVEFQYEVVPQWWLYDEFIQHHLHPHKDKRFHFSQLKNINAHHKLVGKWFLKIPIYNERAPYVGLSGSLLFIIKEGKDWAWWPAEAGGGSQSSASPPLLPTPHLHREFVSPGQHSKNLSSNPQYQRTDFTYKVKLLLTASLLLLTCCLCVCLRKRKAVPHLLRSVTPLF